MSIHQRLFQERKERREAVRRTLLALAGSFGATDLPTRRKLAARFWRLLPRDVVPEEAVALVRTRLAVWSAEVTEGTGPVCADTLRSAVLRGDVDPLLLLSDIPADRRTVRETLGTHLPSPVPFRQEGIPMPVQRLTTPSFGKQIVRLLALPFGSRGTPSTASVRLL